MTLAAEAAWHLADGRLPATDAGALGMIERVYWSLGSTSNALSVADDTLFAPGGWYTWVAAGALRSFGRTLATFDGVAQTFWGATVVSTAWIARRRSGDRAGAVAALLVASMPWVTLLARRHGLQAPQVALAALSFFLVDADRALSRWYTPLLLAGVGAALLALGPTAWIFAFALLPLLFFPGEQRRPGRILFVLAAWGFGTVLGAANAGSILAFAPAEGRAAEATAALFRLGALVERPVGVACIVAVLFWLGARLAPSWVPGLAGGTTRSGASRGSTGVLVAWALAPLVLGTLLRSGPEAYSAGAFALVVLVAGPLGRHPGGVLMAAVAWVAFVLPQAIEVAPSRWAALLPAAATAPRSESPYRFEDQGVARTLGRLLDATCRSDAWASCTIVVDQGLAAPDAADPGRLARFLLAEDRVELLTIYDAPRTRRDQRAVDAVLTWNCGVLDDRWRMRAPDATARLVDLAAARSLATAWSQSLGDPGCVAHWLTPRGVVRRPEVLPMPDPAVAPWAPLSALDAQEAFFRRHPTYRGRQGRGSAVGAGTIRDATPEGWSENGSEWRRLRARGE